MVARSSAKRSAQAICFLSSGAPEANEALERLVARYGNCEPAKADVIVTNPTEFAVALQYDAATMHAPKVVAKGRGYLAARIRQIAVANGIPILPLYAQGYTSIGCEPCTAIPQVGADPRSGRWGGAKLECGIHTFSEKV